MEKLIIIGSGPAGLTAAIYAGRANMQPLVISGYAPGGQLMLTTEMENFPGFPEPILGPQLMALMRQQAERFSARFIDRDVTSVDFSLRPFKAFVEEEPYEAEAIIIATGASAQWLGLESEGRLRGRGVSACATCDGFFFQGKEVIVVGGGDSAMEESLFLTKFARHVTVIHRRDQLRASKIMQERAFGNPMISFEWDSVVEEILGREGVRGVLVKNLKTGKKREIACEGVFVSIGHRPNTDLFKGKIELDERGYIISKNSTETSVPGVFAAGDVCDFRYRQAITAAGAGCRASMDAEKYIESLK